VGEAARAVADGFGGEAIVTAGRDEALSWLRENVSAADVVLVKASRGAALEVVVEALLAPDPGGTEGSST
jgi:UDP-N-acetylmuramoyl-tripeptide--D-alanyl-D-alanine ligase